MGHQPTLPTVRPSELGVITEGAGPSTCQLGHSPHRTHNWIRTGLFTRDSGIIVLSLAALPAVPDLQLLFSLDLPLQLQDAVEERFGSGRAAWGHTQLRPQHLPLPAYMEDSQGTLGLASKGQGSLLCQAS